MLERDPVLGRNGLRAAETLDVGDPVRHFATSIAPTIAAPSDAESSVLATTIAAGGGPGAADRFVADIAVLRREHPDDELLKGLEIALASLSTAEISVPNFRRGMEQVWRQWRRQSRTGASPPVALAGIEAVLDLLLVSPDLARGDLVVEVLEAIADAGISSIAKATLQQSEGLIPALAQARLSGAAAANARWPNLRSLLARCTTTDVLLLRCCRLRSTGGTEVFAAHVTRPDALSLRKHVLAPDEELCLRRLQGGVTSIQRVRARPLEDLVHALLPASLRTRLTQPGAASLTIVPDAALWPVPWAAVGVLAEHSTTIAPSLAASCLAPDFEDVPGGVLALIDHAIDGSAPIVDALAEIEQRGRIRVTRAASIEEARAAGPHALLTVYCHGEGRGLDYSLALPGELVSALDLAAVGLARQAIVAACSSGGAAPPGLALTLTNSMLINGTASLVAGLWPLPARSTGSTVGRIVRHHAHGLDLGTALQRSREPVGISVLERCVLQHFGESIG